MTATVKAPTPGQRRRINTNARVQSVIKAAQKAGLVVKRIIIGADGTITLDSQEETQGTVATSGKAASWDDA
jgi:hypothetical protein